MADVAPPWQLSLDERRMHLVRLYKTLCAEKMACATCQKGARCREPHVRLFKTLGWVFRMRESSVMLEINTLQAEWVREKKADFDEHTEQVMRNLAWVETEAMAEWERSKLPFQQTTTESSTSGAGIESGAMTVRDRRTKGQKILREQTGEVAYLSAVLAVQLQRRAIWGLDAPKRIIPLNPDGTGVFEWMRALARDALNNVIDVTPERRFEMPMQQQLEYLDLPDVNDVVL